MDLVALVSVARNVEEEIPRLAADLGITPYEAGLLLRGPMPAIVLRSEDRAKVLGLLGNLRGRGHDAVACELDAVVAGEDMFCPKAFRVEGNDLVASAEGAEQRLNGGDVFAILRANHRTLVEDTMATSERKLSFSRAAMTGGLLLTKTSRAEERRVTDEREAVLYVFRNDGTPWLFRSTWLRYDGLGPRMRRSKLENFEVLVDVLRELAPNAPYDARLLAVRPPPQTVVVSANHKAATSARALDVLAHVVALSLGRQARPYR